MNQPQSPESTGPNNDGPFDSIPATPVYYDDGWHVLIDSDYGFAVEEAYRVGLDDLVTQATQNPNVEEARAMLASNYAEPISAPSGEIVLDPSCVNLVLAGLRLIVRSPLGDPPSHGEKVLIEESNKLLVAIKAAVNTSEFLQNSQ